MCGTSDPGAPLTTSTGQGGFTLGDEHDLIMGGNANDQVITFGYDATDGTVATGTVVTDEYGTSSCHVSGHVIIG